MIQDPSAQRMSAMQEWLQHADRDVPQPPGDLGTGLPDLSDLLLDNPALQQNPQLAQSLGALMVHHEAINAVPTDPQGAVVAARTAIRRGERKAIGLGNQTKRAGAEALEMGKQAIATQQVHDEKLAGLQSEEAKKASEADATAQKDYLADVDKIKKDIEVAKNEYMTSVDALKNTRVQSWWSTAGTGASVLGLISQALAGGMQGLTGQGGPTFLDRVIDQEMQRQRLELEKRTKVASASQNLYSELMTQFKDRTLAEQAFRQIAYHSTAERMKNMELTLGSSQAKANAEKAMNGLYQKQAELVSTVNQHMATNIMQGVGDESQAIMKGASVQAELDNAKLAHDKKGNQKYMEGLTGIPGSEVILQAIHDTEGPEAVQGVVKKWNAATHIEKNAKTIANLLRTQGERVSKDGVKEKMSHAEWSARIDQNLMQIENDLATVGNLGAISASDERLVTAIAGLKGGWANLLVSKLNPYGRDENELAAALDRLAEASRARVITELNSRRGEGVSLKLPGGEEELIAKMQKGAPR